MQPTEYLGSQGEGGGDGEGGGGRGLGGRTGGGGGIEQATPGLVVPMQLTGQWFWTSGVQNLFFCASLSLPTPSSQKGLFVSRSSHDSWLQVPQLTAHVSRVFETQNLSFLVSPGYSVDGVTPATQTGSVNDGSSHDSVHRSQLTGHRAAAPDPEQNFAFLVGKLPSKLPRSSPESPVVPAMHALICTSAAAHVSPAG